MFLSVNNTDNYSLQTLSFNAIEKSLKNGMRQNELAERMGKTKSNMNDIIKGKEPITVNTALQLELVLGIPAKFWLAREANFREEFARIEQQEAQEF